ncbi:cytochrome c oxidase assembly protein [Rhodococcus spelaei]|uniref:Cytochrome c oxidase assembly protein n=1 Tax=Rhodococcus spelaei TaxID=2546320 RepID=A0A541B9U5_9NOCA|nr:cytochrome c oxidase assembly protein [Rhodococcus spelaei]TQF69097.1 cytochrome c oxidase assembly protein [Rhodococcus spelaei]
MSFVDVPLTLSTALSSWRWDVPTLVVVAALGGGYGRAYSIAARRGAGVGRGRLLCFLLLGCALWLVAAFSFVGVYADTLFWVRALQVVLLLFVVPFGLALGKPVTVARAALGETGRARVDAVVGSRAARALTYPATTSLAMLATPWLLYLTGWYPAVLEHQGVDQLTRLLLVAVGFGYFYSRLQVDPVPHRYSQMISLAITVVEVIGDGVLGIVIWLGPEIAAEYYQQFARSWGPDRRTDQAIGAGILWLLGDVIGIPFLLVLMRAFSLDDRAQAEAIDAELDAVEHATPAVEAEASGGLWWEQDPQMQERFRRQ